MKFIYTFLLILLSISVYSEEELFGVSLENQAEETNKKLNYYEHKFLERPEVSTQGASVIYFFTKDSLKLIKDNIYSEMGQSELLFYMNDTNVYYIVEKITSYKIPLTEIKSFTEKTVEEKTKKYYFYKNKLEMVYKEPTDQDPFNSDFLLQELKELLVIYKKN
jgi:hypothetical protein